MISWTTFHRYWERNFPNIKIRKKGADTCTDCQILCNQFHTHRARTERRRAQGNPLRQEDDDWDSSESEESSLDERGDMDEAEVEEEVELMAVMVELAREYVC